MALSRTAGEGASPDQIAGRRVRAKPSSCNGSQTTFAPEPSKASERQARDILWRLTIAKLRLANPRFLAANGFR